MAKKGSKKKKLDEELDDEDEEEIKSSSKKLSKEEKKRIERKRAKAKKKKIFTISLVVIVIIIVVVIGLWGFLGHEDYLTPSEVMDDKSKYIDELIEVKGTVEENSIDTTNMTFNITDDSKILVVTYTEILPSNFVEGTDVVIKGYLRDDNGIFLEAEEIVVGCPSKY